MTRLGNNGIKKDDILYLGIAAMDVVSLLAYPLLMVKLMVKGKISLKATWRSVNLMTAPAILIYLSALVWINANFLLGLELVLSVSISLIMVTQIGSGLLIFNIAVNWVLEENNALDKATSSKDLISAYTRLINKYRDLKQCSGGLLFLMCFNFGALVFQSAWLLTTVTFILAMPFAMMALANFLLLSILTTVADKAYEMLFLHQEKLR